MKAEINLNIVDRRRTYYPGHILVSEYETQASDNHGVQAVEASVLWFTEGKGDEDMAVHFFERRVPEDVYDGDLRRLHRFEVPLPNSPLSYNGAIICIRWCVRVRVFPRGGDELVQQLPFQLGEVPRLRIRDA